MKNVKVEETVLDVVMADFGDDGEVRSTLDKLIAATSKIRTLDRTVGRKDENITELEAEAAELREELTGYMDPTKLCSKGSLEKMTELMQKLKSVEGQISKRHESIGQADSDIRELIAATRDLANALYDETFVTKQEAAA